MSNPVAVLRRTINSEEVDLGDTLWLWCPGCDAAHAPQVRVTPENSRQVVWEWNGDLVNVTIAPSLLCYSSVHLCEPHPPAPCPNPDDCGSVGHIMLRLDGAPAKIGDPDDGRIPGHHTPHTSDPAWGNCHSFIRNGQWEFLGDCAHRLAGQTVPLVPLPDWLVRDR